MNGRISKRIKFYADAVSPAIKHTKRKSSNSSLTFETWALWRTHKAPSRAHWPSRLLLFVAASDHRRSVSKVWCCAAQMVSQSEGWTSPRKCTGKSFGTRWGQRRTLLQFVVFSLFFTVCVKQMRAAEGDNKKKGYDENEYGYNRTAQNRGKKRFSVFGSHE